MAFAPTPDLSYSIGSGTGGAVVSASLDTTGLKTIIVSISGYADAASVPVLTDSVFNTWTALTTYRTSGASQARIFYCINPTVGPGHTFTGASSATAIYPSMCILGWIEEGAFDTENGASTGSNVTSLNTGNVSPVSNDSLVISAFTVGVAVTGLAVSGGSLAIEQDVAYVVSQHQRGAIAYEVQAGAATRDAAWSWTTATPAAVAIAVFTPLTPSSKDGSFVAGVNTTVTATRAAAFGLDGSTNVHAEPGVLKVFGNTAVTGYQELIEMATPPSSSSNRGRIYIEDNGSGKSRLMVQFGSGAAQQIAIEP
jgi:hypothetical protein